MHAGTPDTAEQERGPVFAILGSLEIRYDGAPVGLTGTIRKRLLTVLLLEAGRVVPVSRLVAAAWADEPPETAAHQVRKTMAELRRRIPRGAEIIVTDGPGYRAVVGPGQLDLLRYRALVRRARAAEESADTEGAARLLRQALELWRGPVLAGEGGPVVDGVSVTLQEERLATAERLYRLLVDTGDAPHVLGELRSLVAEHPLRETLCGHLMLALYRTGQQAAALAEFRAIRRRLADELGIDPGAELTELHARILRQDPALQLPTPAPAPVAAVARAAAVTGAAGAVTGAPGAVPAAAASVVSEGTAATAPVRPDAPHHLPYDVPDFAGRAAELDWAARHADEAGMEAPVILAVDGMGGCGKTAFAIRAAHRLAGRYPGGCLFIDLRGFTPEQEPLSPFDAQGDLLAVAGLDAEEIPGAAAPRSALWRGYTRGRPMLLVLDNAATSEQVRALIPAAPGSLVLVTSRPRLTGLEGANWLSLDALAPSDGREILRHALGEERLAAEPDASAELLRLCGGLPLALRIAAARLANRPHWTIRHFVGRLHDHDRRLDELASEDRGVASTLMLSYQSMTDGHRTAFRLLGLHPGRTLDLAEAAALLDTDEAAAEDTLEALVDVRLLESGEPGGYTFHDLVRSFVGRVAQAEDGPESAPAVRRLLDHYLRTAGAACDLLFPGRARFTAPSDDGAPSRSAASEAGPSATSSEAGPLATPPEGAPFADRQAALGWLDRHRESLLASVDLARRYGLLWHAAYLPRELGFHSSIRGHDIGVNRALETGIAVSRQLDDAALLRLNLTNLAMGKWRLGRLQEAVAHLEEALLVARSMGDPRGEAECVARLGQAYSSLGELGRALRLSEEANRMARELGFTRLDASSLSTLGQVQVRLGRYADAARSAGRALDVFDTLGETQLAVDALVYQSQALQGLGRHEEALARIEEAASRCRPLRSAASALPLVLARRADVRVHMGHLDEALDGARQALAATSHCTDDIHRAAVYVAVACTFTACGEHTTARGHFTHGHEIARRMELRYEEAYALRGLAEVHARLGDRAAAERCHTEAAALFVRMGIPDEARWPVRPGPGSAVAVVPHSGHSS
ncbi:BTAD domain-containing putative transcriptional regulator [Streptomyces monticola]|uniref:BTAD domain-containing putative transcriptional regulator n=1 Tax=Streptomyces monticola TaxID=2666263 RepID=A0ABW2JBT7_9ACTN